MPAATYTPLKPCVAPLDLSTVGQRRAYFLFVLPTYLRRKLMRPISGGAEASAGFEATCTQISIHGAEALRRHRITQLAGAWLASVCAVCAFRSRYCCHFQELCHGCQQEKGYTTLLLVAKTHLTIPTSCHHCMSIACRFLPGGLGQLSCLRIGHCSAYSLDWDMVTHARWPPPPSDWLPTLR